MKKTCADYAGGPCPVCGGGHESEAVMQARWLRLIAELARLDADRAEAALPNDRREP